MNTKAEQSFSTRIAPYRSRWWFKWLVVAAIWCAAGLLITLQSYTYRINAGVPDTNFWSMYPEEMQFFVWWIFLTPLVVYASRRFPVHRDVWFRRLAVHTVIGLAIALSQRMAHEYISLSMGLQPGEPFPWVKFRNHTLGFADYGYFLYCIIVVGVHAYDYSRTLYEERVRGAELREELAVAKMRALKMQLQPHFLFNTLNTIAVLIREEPAVAEQTVGLLSDLLRLTLQQQEEQEAPLKRELEFIGKYLEIESIRFGDRLTVSIDAPPEVANAAVPVLILQPLVENSIRHGIGRRREAGILSVGARVHGDTLELTVTDDGAGYDSAGPDDRQGTGSGIGVANTKSRLQALYGRAGTLTFAPREGGGTIARVALPYRKIHDDVPEGKTA